MRKNSFCKSKHEVAMFVDGWMEDRRERREREMEKVASRRNIIALSSTVSEQRGKGNGELESNCRLETTAADEIGITQALPSS